MIFRRIYGIAKADFFERIRRFSFIAMIIIMVIAVFFIVPNPKATISSITINPDDFAQMSDVSWIFLSASICAGLFFPIVGVIYIKNSISTDRKYGLIGLIQTSAVKKSEFVFGKILSNFFLLLALLFVLLFGTLLMAFIKFPDSSVPIKMLSVIFVGMLPNLVFCATIAVILEILPIFKSNTGSSIGIILCFSLIIASIVTAILKPINYLRGIFDFTNLAWLIQNMEDIVFSTSGKHVQLVILSGGTANYTDNSLPKLLLENIRLSKEFIIGKIMMLILCFIIAFISSYWVFNEQKIFKKNKKTGLIRSQKLTIKIKCSVLRELWMRCMNVSLEWKVVLLLLWGTLFVVQQKIAYSIIYPLLCLGSLPLFSDIGCREYKCGMDAVLSITGIRFIKQLIYEWISALIISIIAIFPLLLRFISGNEWEGAIPYVSFAVFIPSLSTILGEYTKENRVFEIVFIVICYVMLNIPLLILSISIIQCCILVLISFIMLLGGCVKRYKYNMFC